MNMTSVFVWTGFICAMLITIALMIYFCLTFFEMILDRTKMFRRVFKIINKFYDSFPDKNRMHRYVLTLYDYESKSFVDYVYLNGYGQTDEEYQRHCDEMRKRHARNPQ